MTISINLKPRKRRCVSAAAYHYFAHALFDWRWHYPGSLDFARFFSLDLFPAPQWWWWLVVARRPGAR
ncbi:MAG: hypothetical protein U0559_04835 [Anaerolineae bacterium]